MTVATGSRPAPPSASGTVTPNSLSSVPKRRNRASLKVSASSCAQAWGSTWAWPQARMTSRRVWWASVGLKRSRVVAQREGELGEAVAQRRVAQEFEAVQIGLASVGLDAQAQRRGGLSAQVSDAGLEPGARIDRGALAVGVQPDRERAALGARLQAQGARFFVGGAGVSRLFDVGPGQRGGQVAGELVGAAQEVGARRARRAVEVVDEEPAGAAVPALGDAAVGDHRPGQRRARGAEEHGVRGGVRREGHRRAPVADAHPAREEGGGVEFGQVVLLLLRDQRDVVGLDGRGVGGVGVDAPEEVDPGVGPRELILRRLHDGEVQVHVLARRHAQHRPAWERVAAKAKGGQVDPLEVNHAADAAELDARPEARAAAAAVPGQDHAAQIHAPREGAGGVLVERLEALQRQELPLGAQVHVLAGA
jgi:hypothetical protein